MADQPCAWASVGASKLARNQSWTAGENAASASREGAGDGARGVRATGGQYRLQPLFRPDVLILPHPARRGEHLCPRQTPQPEREPQAQTATGICQERPDDLLDPV